jgi:hypothetical protein
MISKIEHGICVSAHMVDKQAHHKKSMSSGVKRKFARGLMIEIGIPHAISRGRDMSDMTNCSSKNEIR